MAPRAAPARSPASATAGAAAHVAATGVTALPAAGAADLAGQWQYTATLGADVIEGTLHLVRSGASYTGTATATVAEEPVPMISMKVDSTKVVMLFDTPDGEARVEGTVSGGTVITGTVALGSQSGTFRAQKRH